MRLDSTPTAMEDGEDTVMRDAISHPMAPPHQLARASASRQSLPAHLNGSADPSLAPSILGQGVKIPLPPRSGSVPATATSRMGIVPVAGPVPGSDHPAEASGLTKSVMLGEERPESPMEANSDWSDEEAASHVGIPLAGLSSGLCYDVQMRYHCEVRPTADVHPEDPRRIYYIYKELCRAGLVDDPESSKPLVSRPLKRINARNATEEEVSLVHTPDHFAFVESTKGISLFSGCFGFED